MSKSWVARKFPRRGLRPTTRCQKSSESWWARGASHREAVGAHLLTEQAAMMRRRLLAPALQNCNRSAPALACSWDSPSCSFASFPGQDRASLLDYPQELQLARRSPWGARTHGGDKGTPTNWGAWDRMCAGGRSQSLMGRHLLTPHLHTTGGGGPAFVPYVPSRPVPKAEQGTLP